MAKKKSESDILKKKASTAQESTDAIQRQLYQATSDRASASAHLDRAKVGTPEYATAKKNYDDAVSRIQELQPKYDALNKASTDAKSAADAQKAQEDSAKKMADAQSALTEATQRAKDKGVNPQTDPVVQQAHTTLQQMQNQPYPSKDQQAQTIVMDKNGQPVRNPNGSFVMQNADGTPVSASSTAGATGLTGPTGTIGIPQKISTGTGTGGSGTGKPKSKKPVTPVTQAEAYASFKEKYPDEAAIIASDPGLTKLFNGAMNATGGAWSVQKFQQAYESSAYYQTHSDAYRNAETARLGHGKGVYSDAYNNAIDNIKQYAIEAGITIDPSNLGIDPKSADQSGHIPFDTTPHAYDPKGANLVDNILHQYWDTGPANKAAIVRYLASKGTVDPTLVGGQAQQNVEQLKSWANDLGLNSLVLKGGANYFTDAATGIGKGLSDINFWHQDLINQAAQAFPIYAKQIQAGASVRGIAAPYINTMANLLETTPDNIDLGATTGDGATVRKALQGNMVDTPMSITDFEQQVRKDPRWATTLNAQNSVESTAHKVLNDWGLTS